MFALLFLKDVCQNEFFSCRSRGLNTRRFTQIKANLHPFNHRRSACLLICANLREKHLRENLTPFGFCLMRTIAREISDGIRGKYLESSIPDLSKQMVNCARLFIIAHTAAVVKIE